MDLRAQHLSETCSDPIEFLNQLRQTTEPIGGSTVYSEDGELVEYEVAIEAVRKANNVLEVKEVDLDAFGVLANHLIACDSHGITPKYSNGELDLLERLANIKAQKEEPASEDLAKNPELSGWVARDKDGNLHVFEVKPKRSIDDCGWWDRDYKCSAIDKNAFRDLKWEDEPVCVKLIIIKEE